MTLVSPIAPDRLHALAAQARAWLLELMAWLVATFAHGVAGRALRAEVRADLFAMRRDLARVIFLLALPRIAPKRGTRRDIPNAPPGFRFRSPGRSIRIIARRIRLRGDLRTRAAALSRVIDMLDGHAASMAQAMSRTPDPAPVLVHVTRESAEALAAPAAAAQDTS